MTPLREDLTELSCGYNETTLDFEWDRLRRSSDLLYSLTWALPNPCYLGSSCSIELTTTGVMEVVCVVAALELNCPRR